MSCRARIPARVHHPARCCHRSPPSPAHTSRRREDEAAAQLVSDPAFKRRVQAACGASVPPEPRHEAARAQSRPSRPAGPRPKLIDPATLGNSVRVLAVLPGARARAKVIARARLLDTPRCLPPGLQVFVGAFRGKGFKPAPKSKGASSTKQREPQPRATQRAAIRASASWTAAPSRVTTTQWQRLRLPAGAMPQLTRRRATSNLSLSMRQHHRCQQAARHLCIPRHRTACPRSEFAPATRLGEWLGVCARRGQRWKR